MNERIGKNTSSSMPLTRKLVKYYTVVAGFLTYPVVRRLPIPYFSEQWHLDADDIGLYRPGLTAAGTVRDSHPVPYYLLSSKYFRAPSLLQMYGLYFISSFQRKKNIHRVMNVIFINLYPQ